MQINKNETFFSNHKKIATIIKIIKNEKKKQFSIKKEKLQILKDKINDYIKEHHDDSLQKHSKIIKIMQFLR